MPSLTIENYVKAIYQIAASQEWHAASTGKLAEALGVSPGTVVANRIESGTITVEVGGQQTTLAHSVADRLLVT